MSGAAALHASRVPRRHPRYRICLIAVATIVERGPIGSSCAADVVPMHRMQRVEPSGASAVVPCRRLRLRPARHSLIRVKRNSRLARRPKNSSAGAPGCSGAGHLLVSEAALRPLREVALGIVARDERGVGRRSPWTRSPPGRSRTLRAIRFGIPCGAQELADLGDGERHLPSRVMATQLALDVA